ncbi:single-stranded DNA-binding protein [Streptomyces kronopolitis]|uniref:single-stranded DNA-binding protein n=1 Tax=Streptomyces kronopolitis TaxID=1612435 RepID=UPI00342EDA3D
MNDTMVTLVGNAATAVEHRQTTAGATVARFRLAATSRRWDKGLERWTDGETSFYTVRSWRGLADNVAASVAVGEPLIVQGRLRLREGEQSPERGGQRWFAAEVDAVAIGHDLTRGTTAFRRGTRPSRTGTDAATPSPAAPAPAPEPVPPMPQQEDRGEALPAKGQTSARAPAAGGRRKARATPAAPERAAAGPSPTGAAAAAEHSASPESSTSFHGAAGLGPAEASVPPVSDGIDSPEKVAVS